MLISCFGHIYCWNWSLQLVWSLIILCLATHLDLFCAIFSVNEELTISVLFVSFFHGLFPSQARIVGNAALRKFQFIAFAPTWNGETSHQLECNEGFTSHFLFHCFYFFVPFPVQVQWLRRCIPKGNEPRLTTLNGIYRKILLLHSLTLKNVDDQYQIDASTLLPYTGQVNFGICSYVYIQKFIRYLLTSKILLQKVQHRNCSNSVEAFIMDNNFTTLQHKR